MNKQELRERFGVINPSFKGEINILSSEGNELLSIIVSSIKTIRNKQAINKS